MSRLRAARICRSPDRDVGRAPAGRRARGARRLDLVLVAPGPAAQPRAEPADRPGRHRHSAAAGQRRPLRQRRFDRGDPLSRRRRQRRARPVRGARHRRRLARSPASTSRPGGAAAFFGAALPDLRNRTVLLDALVGSGRADRLRERLQARDRRSSRRSGSSRTRCSRGWARRRPRTRWSTTALRDSGARSRRRHGSQSVQRASSCSPQQFIRRFEAGVGLTPKRYARVLRFSGLLSSAVRVGPRDWAALAAECGYFDQSHLIHEFRRPRRA